MSRIVEDCELVLKHWGPIEADYGGIGAIIMTRYFIRYPRYHQMFPNHYKIPQSELATSPKIAALGIHKLTETKELLMCKGKHAHIAKPIAVLHITRCKAPLDCFKRITEVIAEVMGEVSGLDPAGRHALRRAMGVVWDDFEVTYREMGIPA